MSKVTYCTNFTENFKFNSYTLNLLMPLSEENATCCALLSQLLKRGCEKYGEMHEIASLLESLYGASVSISSDKLGENISFTLQGYFMDNRFAVEEENILESVLDLMSQLLLHPMLENGAFRKDFFEQEKNNHVDVIRGMINDKRTYAIVRCKEIMFENAPYRFMSNGTLEYLDTLTETKLYEFYRRMLQNSTLMVTYIGHKADIESMTEKYFGQLGGGDVAPICVTEKHTPVEVRTVHESFDVAQGKLCLGLRIMEKTDFYAARLFNVLYGGSPTSKLFMNVREKLSLCYYCSSSFDPLVQCLFVSSGIEFKNYEVAKEEILKQLEDMRKGNISEEEFENGKKYLLDYLKGAQDSHSVMLSEGVRGRMLGIDDSFEEQIEIIKALTIDDIVNVARFVTPDTVYFLKGMEE